VSHQTVAALAAPDLPSCASCTICSQALTSTSDGDVVVWDEQGMSAQMGTRATDRRAIKVMRLHGAAIHHLSCIGGFVVTGAPAAFMCV
jgi:hypothetical protein